MMFCCGGSSKVATTAAAGDAVVAKAAATAAAPGATATAGGDDPAKATAAPAAAGDDPIVAKAAPAAAAQVDAAGPAKGSKPHTGIDVALIRKTWLPARALGPELAATFCKNLASLHPGVQLLFDSGRLGQELLTTKIWITLDETVKRLDTLHALVPVLKDLGRRHVAYGVTVEHYPAAGKALLATLQSALGGKWTPDAEAAWTAVVKLLSEAMLTGATEASSAPPAAAAGRTTTSAAPFDIALIKKTWGPLRARGNAVGLSFHKHLFAILPEAKVLFEGKDMDAQSSKFTDLLGIAIGKLDNFSTFTSVLKSAGQRHMSYGVTAEHYPAAARAVAAAIRSSIGDEWTPPVEAAWTSMCKAAADTMLSGVTGSASRAVPAEVVAAAETLDVPLIRKTWGPLRARGTALGEAFHKHLLVLIPAAKPLFAGRNMVSQSAKWMDIVNIAIGKLDTLPLFFDVLKGLGHRHVAYGVLPSHYPATVKATLMALQGALGDQWTPEVESAWNIMCNIIADTMLAGAAPDAD